MIQKKLDDSLSVSNLEKNDINDIIFIEGSCRIPKIWKIIKECFGKESLTIVNLEEIVEINGATFPGIEVGKKWNFFKIFWSRSFTFHGIK